MWIKRRFNLLQHNLYNSRGELFENYTIKDNIVKKTVKWLKEREEHNHKTKMTMLSIQNETNLSLIHI